MFLSFVLYHFILSSLHLMKVIYPILLIKRQQKWPKASVMRHSG